MKYRVTHLTSYSAAERVAECHNMARLAPRQTKFQRSVSHQLNISPAESIRTSTVDSFGNHVTFFTSNTGYEKLDVEAISTVHVNGPFPDEKLVSPAWDQWKNQQHAGRSYSDFDLNVKQFTFASPRVPIDASFANYAAPDFPQGRPILEALIALTRRIHREFEYDPTATTVTTSVDAVFKSRRGVCQDFAHLQIAMLRSLGIPARYVSGYIRLHPSADESKEKVNVGAAASHAWLSVFTGDTLLGEDGWVDVDPTNDKFLNDEYVTVAWGRDYSDVAPLKGVYTGGGQHSLNVAVAVTPVTG